jgi:hypothetical protein
MGKPGPKQVPVTARIQKSTKGGIVQPSISGMGSIAKMKMSSPAKVDLDPIKKKQEDFKNEMANQVKTKAADLAASKLKKAADDKALYQRKADAYRFNATSLPQAEKNQKNSSWYSVQSIREGADNKKASMKKFETELFNYDTKNKPGSTKGYTAREYAMAKVSGTYKHNKDENTIIPPPPPPSTVTPPVTPPSNSGSGGSNTKNVKITGRIGSDLRRKQYDAKGWAYDDTIKKPKPKPKSKPKSKPKAKAILENNKKTEKKPKLAVTPAKPTAKPTKKQVRKAKSVERKTERAAKVRRKSVQALESGNLAKSRRLKRRETRINKRIEKKKSGQASKAIEPK